MKLRNPILGLFTMLLIGTASPAFAYHGGHSRVRLGFYIGAPLWGAWDYPYYYYPPLPLLCPRSGDTSATAAPSDVMPVPGPGGPTQQPYYRNYCSSPDGYYPKVREMPGRLAIKIRLLPTKSSACRSPLCSVPRRV